VVDDLSPELVYSIEKIVLFIECRNHNANKRQSHILYTRTILIRSILVDTQGLTMSLLDLVPDISLPECEIIYNIGEALLFDDRGDIGFFTYRHRNNHYYNGKKSPNHPSPLHHWQIGALLVIFSEIAVLAA